MEATFATEHIKNVTLKQNSSEILFQNANKNSLPFKLIITEIVKRISSFYEHHCALIFLSRSFYSLNRNQKMCQHFLKRKCAKKSSSQSFYNTPPLMFLFFPCVAKGQQCFLEFLDCVFFQFHRPTTKLMARRTKVFRLLVFAFLTQLKCLKNSPSFYWPVFLLVKILERANEPTRRKQHLHEYFFF